MIDWVNAVLPFPHSEPIYGGVVTCERDDGVQEWRSVRRCIIQGSFDSKFQLQSSTDPAHRTSDGAFTHIWVSGSPKPLQGHNLFGTSDPRVLAAHLAKLGLSVKLGHDLDPFTLRTWLTGRGVKFTRIDVTQMLDVGTEVDASEWIRAAEHHTRMSHRGTGVKDNGTLYFGKRSKFWGLKLYRKHPEITSRAKAHALPLAIPYRDQLLQYALGTVRAEVVLQAMYLKKTGLSDASRWDASVSYSVWEKQMQQLELHANRPIAGSDLDKLPRALRGTYLLWREGRHMRSYLPDATFYRHRAQLKRYGIDIALNAPPHGSNVIPLLRTITAQPKGIPSWAINTPLLLAA